MKIEEIVEKPVVMKEEVSSQNIQGATTTAEHTTFLVPEQSRRPLEKAKKSREPSMTRIEEKVMFLDDAPVDTKMKIDKETANKTSEGILDSTVQEQMITASSTKVLADNTTIAKAQISSEVHLPATAVQKTTEALETVMPNFEKQTKVKFDDQEETHQAMQSIEASQPQMKEVVEPCGNFAQNIALPEGKTTKALKSRDSSISRVQEIVTPMEVTKSQDQTHNESEKAIQHIVPSEPKIKEVVEPYGTVTDNIAISKITKMKANKERDSSVSGVQET